MCWVSTLQASHTKTGAPPWFSLLYRAPGLQDPPSSDTRAALHTRAVLVQTHLLFLLPELRSLGCLRTYPGYGSAWKACPYLGAFKSFLHSRPRFNSNNSEKNMTVDQAPGTIPSLTHLFLLHYILQEVPHLLSPPNITLKYLPINGNDAAFFLLPLHLRNTFL